MATRARTSAAPDRLCNEIGGTGFERGDLERGFRVTGDEYDRHIGRVGTRLERIENPVAAHPLHLRIQEDQVRCRFLYEAQRIFPVGREAQVTDGCEDTPQELDDPGVVVDQKYAVVHVISLLMHR